MGATDSGTVSLSQIENFKVLFQALFEKKTGQLPGENDIQIIAASNPDEKLAIIINAGSRKLTVESQFKQIDGLSVPFHNTETLTWLISGKDNIDALEARLKALMPDVKTREPETKVDGVVPFTAEVGGHHLFGAFNVKSLLR